MFLQSVISSNASKECPQTRLCVLRFSINIGHNEEAIALHFNPRFQARGDTNTIVCNSRQGEWGAEQREPCFPFQQGEAFKVSDL